VSTMGYGEWRTVSRLLPDPLPEIEPVRRFLQTLLQRRLAAERRCDCP